MPVKTLVVGQMQTNCYFFYDENFEEAVIIDPGDDPDFIKNKINDLELKPQAILGTHAHFDHLLGVNELSLDFKIPFYLHKDDNKILKRMTRTASFFIKTDVGPAPQVNKYLKEGQIIKVGSLSLKVIHTPGHTQGGVCFYCQKEKILFSGDLLFAHGGYGRTDLEGGNEEMLFKSIKKILKLAVNTIIYSGHGPKTTIKNEKKYYK
ncbi:hypothetical protein COT75_04275 [Candidatus Beckwithbacteria bacterium CG10_big_fil_rev_8_21_14_0_10_34_10]|uniref:Metallo-beta-lactamase domain-containing protein n=1 Tax=Candidatus Beckwithbacteria bacterium CG10_big_fil_rev_8_21_14_0_10_34_10 TaxID=1974495 RepID=A0A2H0W874_9BACT|nr:MAG: hypothetical protein COT75_04275 [Candidatus Beckwithbacteria bacterium CG10_big_fil_rev_8_21_14_0_10_34_10]